MLRWIYSCVRDDSGKRLDTTATRQWNRSRLDRETRSRLRQKLRANPEFALLGPHTWRVATAVLGMIAIMVAGGWVAERLPLEAITRIIITAVAVVFFLKMTLPMYWRLGRRRALLCGQCAACGYDLRGHHGGSAEMTTCPECGAQWNTRDIERG